MTPMPMTLDELRGRLTLTVPEAGRALGLGRDAAYAAVARGEIPSLNLGRRLVVPVPLLLALLGATSMHTEGPDATSGPTATAEAEKEPRHDQSALRVV